MVNLVRNFLKAIAFIVLAAGLCACEEKNDYQYLITHPVVMKKRMEACSTANKSMSNLEKQHCEIVINASTKFMAIVAEQQTDAEKFGVRILATESDYANAKANVKKIESDIQNLKATPGADVAALHKLEADLITAKQLCQDKQQEVRLLLAVVGISTPN